MKIVRNLLLFVLLVSVVSLCACGDSDWFSDRQKYRDVGNNAHVDGKQRGYAVDVPNHYSETRDGLSYSLEFSRSSYKLGGVVQLRLTVTNATPEPVYFNDINRTVRFLRDDGRELEFEMVDIDEWSAAQGGSSAVCRLGMGEMRIYERAVELPASFFTPWQSFMFAFDLDCFADEHMQKPVSEYSMRVAVGMCR